MSPGYVNSADHRALGQCVLDAVADAGNEWIFPDLTEPRWPGVQYIAVRRCSDPPHEVDVSEHVDRRSRRSASTAGTWSCSPTHPVEEQARQIVDMATATEDGRRRVGFRFFWG